MWVPSNKQSWNNLTDANSHLCMVSIILSTIFSFDRYCGLALGGDWFWNSCEMEVKTEFRLIIDILILLQYFQASHNMHSSSLRRVMLPVALAFTLAECNALMLVAVYIPSSVRTVFKFRYGMIGSLHDRDFQKMRTSSKFVSAFKIALSIHTIIHVRFRCCRCAYLMLQPTREPLFLEGESYCQNVDIFSSWLLWMNSHRTCLFAASIHNARPASACFGGL